MDENSEGGGKYSQRAVIAAVDTGEYDIENSVRELTLLAESAGALVVGEVIQKLEKPDMRTYLGSGKLLEVKAVIEAAEADLLITDTELTAARIRNIEQVIDVAVIDRTTLILDIFASNAVSSEGKLQVELAQLQHRLLNLTGSSAALSRLGGGIGTRGPGESKLESDRRHIRARVSLLQSRLEELSERRELTRERRKRGNVPVVSLIGYTNVGKSSLLNAMTGSDVLARDKLFATLDPTARKLYVGDLQQVILIDTVGFVSRLPHRIVEAFKSTLLEMAESDLIVRVADASSSEWKLQLDVTADIIGQMGCSQIAQLTVFNKCDLIDTAAALPGIPVSAKTGFGLERLLSEISKKLSESVIRCELLLPFDKLPLMAVIRERGNVLNEEYTENGLLMTATVDRTMYHLVEEFVRQ
ncbi:MAG: GTPase HflX [Oscillospiraceae bacterium]|nr:GTPase HflX [Oscillospiraceae bacterium]